MPITHFATNLQQSMNWFHKEHQMDPRFHDTISEDLDDHNNYHYTTATNSQQQQHYNLYNNHQPTAIQINNYNNKEPMFEKPLTPSDVGKLNRLVIPKQHAEKYFPLNGSNFINSSNNNDSPPSSGTLLGFEDESGKSWRFRYSYWNSSQSYVLTKGWSRYVKEKRLNAGDVVFFERDLVSPDRLFIGWRRRAGGGGGGSSSRVAAVQDGVRSSYGNGHVMRGGYVGQDTSICSSSGADGVVGFGISPPYRSDHASSFHTGTSAMQSHKQTPGSGTSNSNMRNKRLFRLFGVNLECQPDDYSQSQTTSSESSSLSSQQQQQQQGPSSSSSVYGGNYFDYAAGSNGNGYHHHQSHYHHHHHHQMDINYPQGVNNQMGNRLG